MVVALEFLMDEKVDARFLGTTGTSADARGFMTNIDVSPIERDVDNEPRIGEGGEPTMPTTFKAMNCSATLKGISKVCFNLCVVAHAQKTMITLQLTGKAQDRYDPTIIENAVMKATGYVLVAPIYTSMTPKEKAEMSLQIGMKEYYQALGSETLRINPSEKIYEVNGVNLWV